MLDVSHSASALGTVLAARSIPMVALMLYGGVIADRLPGHAVLAVANAVCFGTQGIAAALLLSGTAHAWQLGVLCEPPLLVVLGVKPTVVLLVPAASVAGVGLAVFGIANVMVVGAVGCAVVAALTLLEPSVSSLEGGGASAATPAVPDAHEVPRTTKDADAAT